MSALCHSMVFDVSGHNVRKYAIPLSSSFTIIGQTAVASGIGIITEGVIANDKNITIIRDKLQSRTKSASSPHSLRDSEPLKGRHHVTKLLQQIHYITTTTE